MAYLPSQPLDANRETGESLLSGDPGAIVTFELLYAFIIVRLARRDLVWINARNHEQVHGGAQLIARVTSHPTAERITHQITEFSLE
jgi:hypothetical protein